MLVNRFAFPHHLAKVVENSFLKFWNASGGYCYDVIDSPGIGRMLRFAAAQLIAIGL